MQIYEEAIKFSKTQKGLDNTIQASLVYDIVFQVIDLYAIKHNFVLDKKSIKHKSLGKKLKCLEKDNNENLKKSIKEFRSLRLTCEKSPLISNDLLNKLITSAKDIISNTRMGAEVFYPSIPFQNKVINEVSIETNDGYKSFELVHGNIITIDSDLLVVSTNAQKDKPLTGPLIGLLKKEDIVINSQKVLYVASHEKIWTCFQTSSTRKNLNAILTLRMNQSENIEKEKSFFDDSIKCIFSSLSALEYQGYKFSEISLPVIGNTTDYNSTIESLVRNSILWLKKSSFTKKIIFVVYDHSDLLIWDEALDKIMGRSYSAPGNSLSLEGIIKEVVHLLHQLTESKLHTATIPLLHALEKNENVCIENICVFGRKLCELMCLELLKKHDLNIHPMLMNNIETLQQSKIIAPWISSYMHSLRIFGNETVHMKDDVKYKPNHLNENDLIASLSAIKSLVSFWKTEVE